MADLQFIGVNVGIFDRQIATAQRLVERYGQKVQWKSFVKGAPSDPLKPWLPTEAIDNLHDVFICFVPARDSAMRLLLASLKGSEITVGRLAGLMGAVDFEPARTDSVIRDGVELSVDNIDLLSPNGQKILYTIEFKG